MTFHHSRRTGRQRLVLEHLESRCLLAADPLLPAFQVRLQPVDLAGNPLERVEVGQEFDLKMLARDLRTMPDAKGLFAVFADMVYRDSLVQLSQTDGRSPVTFGPEYENAHRYDVSVTGLVNEMGAVAGVTPVGTEELLVASVRFRASAAGLARFGLDSADDLIMHPMLAYGLFDTSNDVTVFHGTSLLIVGRDGSTVPDDGWTPAIDTTASEAFPPGSDDARRAEESREQAAQTSRPGSLPEPNREPLDDPHTDPVVEPAPAIPEIQESIVLGDAYEEVLWDHTDSFNVLDRAATDTVLALPSLPVPNGPMVRVTTASDLRWLDSDTAAADLRSNVLLAAADDAQLRDGMPAASTLRHAHTDGQRNDGPADGLPRAELPKTELQSPLTW